MQHFLYLAFLAVGVSCFSVREKRGLEEQAEEKIGDSLGESGYHHQIDHEHAKSHQSIKFEHFHPVPVYVKKEHSNLLHHPIEKGKFEHNLKQIHPQHEHKLHHGGLVLENHRYEHDVGHGYQDFSPEQHAFLGERSGVAEVHEGFQEEQGHEGFQGQGEWAGISGDQSGYGAQGLQEGDNQEFQYKAVDFSQLGLQEHGGAGEEESYH